MATVAEQYPAVTDSNGTTWYRPERKPGEGFAQWGWTALPEHADASYGVNASGEHHTHNHTTDAAPTPTKDTTMTAIADDGTIAGRTTEHMGYPLPPEPPRYQPKFNGWKQYLLPSPSTGRPTGFSRASTVADTLDDTFGLSRWKRRETAKFIVKLALDAKADPAGDAALRMDQLVNCIETASKVGDIDAFLDALDNDSGGADARELGTAVHAWLEALDLGQVTYDQVPAMFLPYVDAYYDILRRYGLVPVAAYVERIVLNDRGQETVVGTLDRIYRVVATGELVLGDVKTSKSLEYSWLPYAVQLAIYGFATYMLSTDGTRWEPMPAIRQDFAILMHVPSDQPERSEAVTMDLWWGGETTVASLEARQRRRDAKKLVPFKHAIPIPTDEALRYAEARMALTKISSPDDLTGVWERYQDVWDDALTEFGNTVAEHL